MKPFPLQFFSVDFSAQSGDFAFLRMSPARRAAYFDLMRLDCLNDGIPEDDDLCMIPAFGISVEDLVAVAGAFFTARSETTGRRSLPVVAELRAKRITRAAENSERGREAVMKRKVRPVKTEPNPVASPHETKATALENQSNADVVLSKIKPSSSSSSSYDSSNDESKVAAPVPSAQPIAPVAAAEVVQARELDLGPTADPSGPRKRAKTAKEPQRLPFASPEFATAWQRYERHRQEMRKPMTPTARWLALEKLASLPESVAIAALDRSVTAGWLGLFPEQNKTPNGTTRRSAPDMSAAFAQSSPMTAASGDSDL